MRYIPNTPEDRKRMLEAIGADGFEELVAEVPDSLRLKGPLDLPPALDEMSLMAELHALADMNADGAHNACFLGAGAYDHFVPSVVGHLASRAEFLTAYTPYQAEVSQGTLQAAFEYQTMVCELTGMEAANASMYDGASAMAEAALMAQRITRRTEIAVSTAVHPNYRRVLRTYLFGLKSPVVEIPYSPPTGLTDLDALKDDITDNTSCVIVQYPNFFGCIEELAAMAGIAHGRGALLVVVADPIALGLLKSPGELGADIVVGEGQPLGKSMSFGGPYLGLFACREEHLRQMPGRVVGETTDSKGRRGYVLTLQAREQHIKRERATSNICTNEAHVALVSAIYMAAMGREGMRKAAELCLQNSHYALDELIKRPGVKPAFSAPFFKEFAVKLDEPVGKVNRRLLEEKIIGGLDMGLFYPELSGHMLITVTEKRTKAEIDTFAAAL